MAATNGHVKGDDTITLPVINISNVTAEVGRQMIDAAARHGFLYVDTRGTDFTPEVVNRQFELSKQFFSSPEEEKAACKIGPDNKGWSGMHSETLDPAHQKRGDFKEAFNIGEFVDKKAQQAIPKSLQNHEAELRDFELRCRKTCHRILRLLALGLEIPDPEWFSSRHKTPSGCTLRLLHYPALPADTDYQPEVDIRAGAHSDYGSITLLFQRPSQPGLEILTSTTTASTSTSNSSPRSPQSQQEQQNWSPVPVIPSGYIPETSSSNTSPPTPFPPILLNIGDLFSYWTHNLLKSTIHRVIFAPQEHIPNPTPNDDDPSGKPPGKAGATLGQDRYSIAYFCHPTDTTDLEAVPSPLVAARASKKRGEDEDEDEEEEEEEEEEEAVVVVGYGGGAGGRKVLTAKEHLTRRLEATYGFVHE